MKEKPASLYYYKVHKESLPFFKEKLDKGWHVFSTNCFYGREKFELRFPCEKLIDNKDNLAENREDVGYRVDHLTELKTKHAIVDFLIKAERS